MAEFANVTLNPNTNTGPTIEQSYEALKAEGVIQDDAEGALVNPDPDAQGGAAGETGGDAEARPAGLPEKFKSVDDLLKAYQELERKQSSQTTTQVKPAETQPVATEAERKAAEDATTKAGLDLAAVSAEWATNNGLKDETYAKLAEAGYPREMVDIYIEGLTQRTNATVNKAYDLVGGQEAYSEMIGWAANSLSEAEQSAFNQAVNSNNPQLALMAVQGLQARWAGALQQETSQEPEVTIGGKGRVAADVYQTLDDYMADLNNPKYDTNETYRRQVMAKLARSPNI